jgi:hypothetical protein
MSNFIRSIKLERLTNGSFHELCRLVLVAVDGVNEESLSAFLTNFQFYFKDFDKLMKQLNASALSRTLAGLDAVRDGDFRFFRALLNYALKSKKADVAEAANVVDVVFRNYRDVAKMSYPDETANMTNLIRDLRDISVFAQLQKIPFAEDILDVMEESNNKFRTIYEQRSDESVAIITGGTFDARKMLTTALRGLVKGFESALYIGGSQALREAAKKIDKLFENSIREMSRRGNGGSHSKDKDKDDNDGDGPIEISDMTAEDFFTEEENIEIHEDKNINKNKKNTDGEQPEES